MNHAVLELQMARAFVTSATSDGWSYDTRQWDKYTETSQRWPPPERDYAHPVLIMSYSPVEMWEAEPLIRLKEVTIFDQSAKPVAVAAYLEDVKIGPDSKTTITALAYQTPRGLRVLMGALLLLTRHAQLCLYQVSRARREWRDARLEKLLHGLGFKVISTLESREETKDGVFIRPATKQWCRAPTFPATQQ